MTLTESDDIATLNCHYERSGVRNANRGYSYTEHPHPGDGTCTFRKSDTR
jgi:hypothetical protein